MSSPSDTHAPVPVAVPGQRTLGGYEVLAALKSGGMGDVLLARRVGAHGFEKLVAIKTMRAEFRDREDARKMFFDEAQLLARLDHPAIAQVYDFGEDGDELYLAMEYVEGVRFSRLSALDAPPAVCVQAMAEVLRGLHAVHELTDLAGHPLNVVHRDITPENLMMTFAGRVKVLDFGIALVRGRQAPVTELGTIKGKPPYMSPEQIKSEPIDRRTDIFSAAIVLHEMLAREPLFTGDSVFAIARKIELEDAPPPSIKAGALPGDLDAVVLRGLARDREQRYATAEAFAHDLDRVARAIGGERLESYAGRELAAARDEHRARLQELLASVESRMAAGPMYGRPSGVMTAPADPTASAAIESEAPAGPAARHLANRQASAIAASQPVVSEPLRREDLGPKSARPPGRGETTGTTPAIRRWLVGAFAAALLGGVAWFGLVRDTPPPVPTQAAVTTSAPRADRGEGNSPTGTTDQAPQPAPVPGDPADVQATSGAPDEGSGTRDLKTNEPRERTNTRASEQPLARRKAADLKPGDGEAERGPRRRRKSRRAEDRRRRDSAAASAGPVTSEVVERSPSTKASATEFGFLTVGAEPYALVRLDGKEIGVTPIFRRRIAAGEHEVTLASPDTGAVRLKKTVTVRADKTATVMLR